MPSKLRILSVSLPKSLGFIDIPDSVEFLRFVEDVAHIGHFALNFGIKSNLRGIDVHNSKPWGNLLRGKHGRRRGLFVRLCEHTLKAFRSTLEWYDGHVDSGICFLDSASRKVDFPQYFIERSI
jgi:hypothetical protein